MKRFFLWFLAFVITIGAAYYQRKSGPTYPKSIDVALNDTTYNLKLVRSLGLDERPEVKLKIYDPDIKARIFFKRFRSEGPYETHDFKYKVYPVDSYLMNKVFNITEERGLFAEIPQQPPAGKIQYYIEITDSKGTITLFRENPIVIRFKGAVPGSVLTPHILFMFLAMLLSTLTGLMAIVKYPGYKRYGIVTLIVLGIGGMIMGPLVQKYAFGELWTGIPFGWDLTDNKTLIAFLFWIAAVWLNIKKDRPAWTIVASVVLILIFSVPHSMFGSELDYETGKVIQGLFIFFLFKPEKNIKLSAALKVCPRLLVENLKNCKTWVQHLN